MRYLHTMVRVHDIDASINFYCNLLGMIEISRKDLPGANATLIFLAAPEDEAAARENKAPMVELTYNHPDADGNVEDYGSGRN
ncbi:MAG: VOC family protein, partial [Pseudomonadota bacterium]